MFGDVVVAGTHAEAVVIFQFVIIVRKSLSWVLCE